MAVNAYHSHFHKRRKKKKSHAPIDKFIYFAVIFGPLMTIPQVYDIWILNKTAVSVITWAAYSVIAVIWLLYGIKHRDKPLIIVQALWLILDIAVVSGVLIA